MTPRAAGGLSGAVPGARLPDPAAVIVVRLLATCALATAVWAGCARHAAGSRAGVAVVSRHGDVASTRARRRVPTDGRVVRVVLAEGVAAPQVTATGAWTIGDAEGGTRPARGGADTAWTVERRGEALRALGPAGGTSWRTGPLVVRAAPGAFVVYGGRRWRGELWVHAGPGSGVTVVNRLPAEEYLRGVVPLELDGDGPSDQAALEAQAVAARSYTYSRLAEFLPRAAAVARARLPFDVRATVRDQVYGGAGAERPATDRAILATAGLVLRYDGAVVSAPYHSTCGGSTAAPAELWGAEPAPYLHAVSDRMPGSERAYCDRAPRFRWTRTWDGVELEAVLARYLRAAAASSSAPGDGQAGSLTAAGPTGAVRAVDVLARTPSGRAGSVAVRTHAGRFVLRGNAIRFALRARGGEILPSTYFTATAEPDGTGRVRRLVVRGGGNGHGVGMCQWGAIGRARAGQDFRTILRTYYPGITVEPVE